MDVVATKAGGNGYILVHEHAQETYVEVGADGFDRESIMAEGVSTSMYERQLMAWVFSLKPYSRMLAKQLPP